MEGDWEEFRYTGPEFSLSYPPGWHVLPGIAGATLVVAPVAFDGMSFVPNVNVVFAAGAEDPLEYLHGSLGEMRAQLASFATGEVRQEPGSEGTFMVFGEYEREGQRLCLWQRYRVGTNASMIVTGTCAVGDREAFETLLCGILESASLSAETEAALGTTSDAT